MASFLTTTFIFFFCTPYSNSLFVLLKDSLRCLFIILFFPHLRIMCKCGSCGSKKYTPSEWERHTGCRAKKWKYSVKVKGTMLPLEKWVCTNYLHFESTTSFSVFCILTFLWYSCFIKLIKVTFLRKTTWESGGFFFFNIYFSFYLKKFWCPKVLVASSQWVFGWLLDCAYRKGDDSEI